MSSTTERIEAFRSWLVSTGTSADEALFDRATVEGLVLLAGDDPVTAQHVEDSVSLLRDRKLPAALFERVQKLGERLVLFERDPDARARDLSPSFNAEKAQRFQAWLEKTGTKRQLRTFDRPAVEGLLLFADGKRVEPQHLEAALEVYAMRKLPDEVIERLRTLGALVLHFDSSEHALANALAPSEEEAVLAPDDATQTPLTFSDAPPEPAPATPSISDSQAPLVFPSSDSVAYPTAVPEPVTESATARTIRTFHLWLQDTARPEDLALFEASAVEGLLLLANGAPLQMHHVAESVGLAKGGGMSAEYIARTARLGQLLVRFEQRPHSKASDVEPMPIPLPEPEPEAPAAPAPPRASAPRVATEVAPIRKPKRALRSRRMLAVGAAVLAIIAAVAGLAIPSGPSPSPNQTKAVAVETAAASIDGLAELNLNAKFPAGWHRTDVQGVASAATGVVLFHGAKELDADRRAFVGVLDRAVHVDAGAVVDDSLLEWTRAAEEGAAAHMTAGSARYVSAGCEIVRVGGERAGRCLGASSKEGITPVWLHTWLRVGEARSVLAVFSERATVPSAASISEINDVVSTLTP